MESHYKRIYTGPGVIADQIATRLKEVDIIPLLKDESESGRLAGFAPQVYGYIQVFVHEDELEKAQIIMDQMGDITKEGN
ncbi:putative signal transducing protein [Zhouia amylolytica]|uniref:DUF2007 domain-containing protein n=1 Tax=Zhouia amylolytica AD3 TaxID=1286632 RepID=W2UQ00_9FLAO|nr:DUF2007 domain-containing protein [Zhouia amylolytica]ETN95382.1 hypothetical protein P278_11040 [Zhouia amylolytica AD3]